MEEAWEFAALVMIMLRLISVPLMLGLVACGSEGPESVAQVPVIEALEPTTPIGDKKPRTTDVSVRARKRVLLKTSYSDENSKPRYANLTLSCFGKRQWLLVLSDGVPAKVVPGTFISNSGDTKIWTSNTRGFWTVSGTEIFFDGKAANLPSVFKDVSKEKIINGERTKTKFSQVRNPVSVIEEAFIPKFKTSKTMSVIFKNGRGPTFDLDGLEENIIRMETQCAGE